MFSNYFNRLRSTLFFFLVCSALQAQDHIPINGIHDQRNSVYVFENVTIHKTGSDVIENAMLIVQGEKISYVGPKREAPNGSVITDLKGKHIYPSFIDLYSKYGIQAGKTGKEGGGRGPQLDRTRKGPVYWNDAIKADYDAVSNFNPETKASKDLLASGFGVVLTGSRDGIARGTDALVHVGEMEANEAIIASKAAAEYSFKKGSSTQDYPTSLVGAIALLRQSFYDADWYKSNEANLDFDLVLDALNANGKLPQLFDAGGVKNVLRANKVGKEFEKDLIIVGSGNEYQHLDELKAEKPRLVIPLKFPEAFDLSDPLVARNTSLKELMHWEQAPRNAYWLNQAGIAFCLTAKDLKKSKDFIPALRQAVEAGLPADIALDAVTGRPARFLKVDHEIGSLKNGLRANFFIADDDILKSGARILAHWTNGKPVYQSSDFGLEKMKEGVYSLEFQGKSYELMYTLEPKESLSYKLNDSTTFKAKGNFASEQLSFYIQFNKEDGRNQFSGWKDEKGFAGTGINPKGVESEFTLVFESETEEKPKKGKKANAKDNWVVKELPFPFGPYGLTEPKKQEDFAVVGATIWSNSEKGIFRGDVIVRNGKIFQVGESLNIPDDIKSYDGKGKHLSSGVIDEHSHIALSTVNEAGQNSSAEVRMGDVIDPNSIHIYRQLAGGVTSAQLLHGSANPVGGQSAIIKFRWGSGAEDLKIDGAAPFIKFALGENVKQSNWGDLQTIRYPQTRMGVEQVYEDLFTRALDYEAEHKAYNSSSKKSRTGLSAPRRDLELETMLEIIRGKRFISCHSYVQSEINMLMKVAERFDFKINTFTHILEGYKVAHIMKEHGAGGSTFSDWWAYKFEVKDAIPYNAAIMTKVGVTTAINSDDSEMARRLNQEAAKSVKYGGLTEEDAWKLVTLNPAKLLHLDEMMGSVEVGKDADLVIWDAKPLSIDARVDYTFVDGKLMYSEELDLKNRAWIKETRAALTQKMLEKSKENGKKGKLKQPEKKQNHNLHCDSMEYEIAQ